MWEAAMATTEPDRDITQLLLLDTVRVALVRAGAEDWTMRRSTLWCFLAPPEHAMREHGWKLHVSATPMSAATVLARVAPLLIARNCPFKFARSVDTVVRLVSRNAERGGGGKVVTVYPDDDDQFRALAEELHEATYGLPGPSILSDRRYRPDSLVYYRYGGFRGNSLGNDGVYENRLVGPDGDEARDVRNAWFSPPPWAPPPFPAGDTARAAASNVVPRPVLLGGRFMVREAIRQSYRGGVYRARDQETGATVIVKQARRHADSNLTGSDAQDGLRVEADLLDRLAPAGVAPRRIALFEQQGDLFLAEELVAGVTLHEWVVDHIAGEERAESRTDPAVAVAMARRLVDALAAVHALGVVHRDFNPYNLMVGPDGEVRLIDLEMAVRPGAPVGRIGTFGYAPSEQLNAPLVAPAPMLSADRYSLGACLLYLATGVDPVLLRDEPVAGPVGPRLAGFLDLAVDSPAARVLRPLVLGLTADDPDLRWSLDRAREFLDALPATTGRVGPPGDRPWVADDQQERLIRDGLDHLLDQMRPHSMDRLWRSSIFGMTTDPCAVQHGAAGVLSVLTRAATVRADERLLAAVRTVVDWIERRLPDEPRTLPGLYFGRSGTAWALHDAATLLGDAGRAGRALDLARQAPFAWPNPDVCHGVAGAGLAALYLWRATGAADLADRAVAAADHLVATVERGDAGVMWRVPSTFASELAGIAHYGFGHGLAGVGAFLLAAGQLTGEARYLGLARSAGDTLVRAAVTDGAAAWWPNGDGTGEPSHPLAGHWCTGSSGVGTYLVRLARATGDPRYADLARASAVAARRRRWNASPAVCHGLAGDGHFFLDLAELLDDPRYVEWAEEQAAWIHARRAVRYGQSVVADETQLDVVADFHTGLSGTVGYLLRLRHGGPRPWLIDAPAATPTTEATPTAGAAGSTEGAGARTAGRTRTAAELAP
jgi:serine/threonine protein kinase